MQTTLQMLWADELLENQSQMQTDLQASADLFVSGKRRGPPEYQRVGGIHAPGCRPVSPPGPGTLRKSPRARSVRFGSLQSSIRWRLRLRAEE